MPVYIRCFFFLALAAYSIVFQSCGGNEKYTLTTADNEIPEMDSVSDTCDSLSPQNSEAIIDTSECRTIDYNKLPTDRPLTDEEFYALPFYVRMRHRYHTKVNIYEFNITDSRIKSAVIDYINSLEPEKRNGDLTIVAESGWVDMNFGKIYSESHDSREDLYKTLGFTIINGRVVYIYTYGMDCSWIKVNKNKSIPYDITFEYGLTPMGTFFSDGVPNNPIIFINKWDETQYYRPKKASNPTPAVNGEEEKDESKIINDDTVRHADQPVLTVSESKYSCSTDTVTTDSL